MKSQGFGAHAWGSVGVLWLLISASLGGNPPGACSGCGCTAECHKVCRLVCYDKKITKTCWGMQDEDFCIPGPSCLKCTHEGTACSECDSRSTISTKPRKWNWKEWLPGQQAEIHTKTKLMKKTVTKTIPAYKWVVEDLCPECQQKQASATVPAGTAVPPAPSVREATVLPPEILPAAVP